jgi:predicted DNA-binding transcriptional regulator AlpA
VVLIAMQTHNIDEQLIRGVIASLGFPADRVEHAVACLLNRAERHQSEVRQLLSFDDVRRILAVSRSTLRRMIVAGQLKPVQITARRIGFISSDIDGFIKALPPKTVQSQGAGGASVSSTVT